MVALVSVLIPCYNGEKFIDRCFSCLLNQDYDYVEIIFVNDGSNDNSSKIAYSYKNKLEQKGYSFKYVYQSNGGAASAINTALKLVTGKYIMLYDVDDIIFRTAISEKVKFLEINKEYDMVRNNGYIVNNNNIDEVLGLFTEDESEKENKYIFEDLIMGKTNNWPATFMVRSEALFSHIKDKEIYISQYGQNLQIMLPVCYFGKSGYIDKPLMKYIRHNNSHSDFTDKERKLKLYNGYESNRIEIINSLDIRLDEKKVYIKKVNLLYYRIRMQVAYEMRDHILLSQEYKKLKELKENTREDDILYRRGNNFIYDNLFKLVNLIYRVKNKIKREI